MERANARHAGSPRVWFPAVALAAIVGYLLGSFPTAQIVGRICLVDPTLQGDRNPGWWNMRALVGDLRAAPVLIVDTAKGAAAAAVGIALWGPWWTAYAAVLFAMLGHSFPLFAHLCGAKQRMFRGGKAILTWAGGMLVLATTPGLIAIATGIVIAVIVRRTAWGPLVATFTFPFLQALFQPITHVAATGVLMTFIGLRFAAGFAGRIRDLSTSERAKRWPV